MTRSARLVVLATAATVAACSNGERLRTVAGNGPAIGTPLPAFEVTDLGDQPFDLAILRGRVLVLNLWATWCYPCREEMPELQELQAAYDPGELSVVGLSVDTEPSAVTFVSVPFSATWMVDCPVGRVQPRLAPRSGSGPRSSSVPITVPSSKTTLSALDLTRFSAMWPAI